ncbi:hypothetical protein PanWU01x14_371650 [Parasponia andersonii]|uniref:Uncharacterized protein n=1 Tax=Parasponia andersonii TaxID=3476 RepID=A0A2P5A3T5_PARAD|nr:hypothetical protein PanWU01x14_371650 [Parasponia andersonii]
MTSIFHYRTNSLAYCFRLLRMPPRRVLRHQLDAEPPRLDFTHLIEAMQQAFVQMSNPDYQAPAPRERQLDQADHLQRFMRLQPGHFDGRPEALTAIAWLREMERHFRALGTPIEFWVVFAVTRLTGSTIRWWETVERMQDVVGLT